MTQDPFDPGCLDRRNVPRRRFDPGERIFLEHEAGDCMYVVRSGRVEVITFGTVLDSVGPNAIFGEIALIDGRPRSAAALAAEATEVSVVDKETFHALVVEEPAFALAIMRRLAERVRHIGRTR